MPVAQNSDTTFEGNLKRYYANFREHLFPIITPAWAQIKKLKPGQRGTRWGGSGVRFDVVTGEPVGWHFSDSGRLPESQFTGEVQGEVQAKRMYVRRQFDALASFGTRDRSMAYVSLGEKINEEMQKAYNLGVQEALHGDGQGIKATVVNVVSGTQVDVENPYGISGAGQGALWIGRNSQIAILDSTGATNRGTATVTAVALQSGTDRFRLTLGTSIGGVVNGDLIVSASTNNADTSFNAYPNGFTNILNRGGSYQAGTAALHGILTANHPRWNTVRLVAGTDVGTAAQIAEGDVIELMMRVAGRSGENAMQNPKDFFILTTPGLKKSLIESRQGQAQLTLREVSVKLDGGYATDYTINGVPVLDDPYMPVGCVYLIHKPSLGWVDVKDFTGVQMNETSAWRWIADRDAYETSNSIIYNVLTTKRNAHGLITGYTDTSRYSPVVG